MHNANGNVLFGSEKEIAKNKLISKIKSKPEAKLSQYESRLSTNKNKTKHYKINEETKASKEVARSTEPKGRIIYKGGKLFE